MKKFSIKELESFSDVKAHTIRVWEQRYGLLRPDRNDSNIRSYTLPEVKKLLAIAILSANGFRISQLAGLDTEVLTRKTEKLGDDGSRRAVAVSQLIVYMFSSDIEAFEEVLDSCVLYWGVDIALQEVVMPFLEKVQLLSYKDSSLETHLVVTAIRKKIILGIEKAAAPALSQKTALLFLAEGEHYDLILLYMAYILKRNGVRVWYLGTNISQASLEAMTNAKRPSMIYTFIPQKKKFRLQPFSSFLHQLMPGTPFYVAGCTTSGQPELMNTQFIHYHQLQETLTDSSPVK